MVLQELCCWRHDDEHGCKIGCNHETRPTRRRGGRYSEPDLTMIEVSASPDYDEDVVRHLTLQSLRVS